MIIVFDEEELRRFDGSIKKNTAFAKKLVSNWFNSIVSTGALIV